MENVEIVEDISNLPRIFDIDTTGVIEAIDELPWSNALARRTQHYGYEYGYNSKKVTPTTNIPVKLIELLDRIRAVSKTDDFAGYFADVPNEKIQVIVNEYDRDQGISSHKDSDRFGPVVISVSLLAPALMIFRRGTQCVEYQLRPNTAVVLEGEFRTEWTHEISRKKRIGNYTKPADYRRVSVTYRTI